MRNTQLSATLLLFAVAGMPVRTTCLSLSPSLAPQRARRTQRW